MPHLASFFSFFFVWGGGGENFVCLFDRFSLNTSKLYASFRCVKHFCDLLENAEIFDGYVNKPL